MDLCEVVECENTVNKRGHTLCYDHWLENRDGLLSGDEELKSLDDHLPRMLRKFNIPVD